MSDISEFVSVVAKSPERISSRSQLREHEKRHNVVQTGNDFPVGTIAAANDKKWKSIRKKAAQSTTGWIDKDF